MTRVRVAILAAAALASGCVSTNYQGEQTVGFDAFPRGATVRVLPGFDEPTPTPTTLHLSRNQDFKAYFEKTGYVSQTVELRSRLRQSTDTQNGWAWGGSGGSAWDLVVPAALMVGGLVEGASNGGTHELVPGIVRVTLLPLSPSDLGPQATNDGPPSRPSRTGPLSNPGSAE